MESSFSGIGVCPRWKGRLAAWHEVTPRNTRRQNTSTLEALANARPKRHAAVAGGRWGIRGQGREGSDPLPCAWEKENTTRPQTFQPVFQTCFCSGRREGWGWR